ncbi:hypothetical protein HK099_004131 [Clydaea vesicula]|uniref:Uncharacterized protein n=1 Tax=Clydaea vesicula TaxID=447962 RepID=A0AAD5U138_9FUNG|nr:hypothetical protein HK099_004131 [Clydaea vesicula]
MLSASIRNQEHEDILKIKSVQKSIGSLDKFDEVQHTDIDATSETNSIFSIPSNKESIENTESLLHYSNVKSDYNADNNAIFDEEIRYQNSNSSRQLNTSDMLHDIYSQIPLKSTTFTTNGGVFVKRNISSKLKRSTSKIISLFKLPNNIRATKSEQDLRRSLYSFQEGSLSRDSVQSWDSRFTSDSVSSRMSGPRELPRNFRGSYNQITFSSITSRESIGQLKTSPSLQNKSKSYRILGGVRDNIGKFNWNNIIEKFLVTDKKKNEEAEDLRTLLRLIEKFQFSTREEKDGLQQQIECLKIKYNKDNNSSKNKNFYVATVPIRNPMHRYRQDEVDKSSKSHIGDEKCKETFENVNFNKKHTFLNSKKISETEEEIINAVKKLQQSSLEHFPTTDTIKSSLGSEYQPLQSQRIIRKPVPSNVPKGIGKEIKQLNV